MSKFTIEYLKKNQLIIFEGICGSKAYGLDTPQSDTDIRGVYILPEDDFYAFDYPLQIQNESNDIVYYEIKKFLELLSKNNPTMLELLNLPPECVLIETPLFQQIKQTPFLSKLCFQTFAGYAHSQIKKARGLNKKILNPMAEQRKFILDFCYITDNQRSVPLIDWLSRNQLLQEKIGLVKMPNMREVYAVFYDSRGDLGYKGIMQKETANDVALSSVPKTEQSLAYLSFNKDGYTSYCKDYKEYWEWVEKRNDIRYQNTLEHGKNYDAKNMMHTFRLLDMAEEIATKVEIIVRRPNREFLFQIRKGEFEYETLLKMAEERLENIEIVYQNSTLPDAPNELIINNLLVQLRKDFYRKHL
jgi:predicted nucleotidyltransferase